MRGRIKGDKSEVARIVTDRISVILSNGGFTFTTSFLYSIHRTIFHGIFEFAGKTRESQARQKEWVLGGACSTYCPASEIEETLGNQFREEKEFIYKGLSRKDIVKHFSVFVSGIWQTHPFEAGNTGAISVFVILYLKSMGFNVNLDMYEKHSRYLRNALVRANYNDLQRGITADSSYLYAFFDNILFNSCNVLNNRYVHVHRDRSALAANKKDNVWTVGYFFKNNPGASAVSAAAHLNIPLRTVQRCISKLQGKIEHRGSKKTGGYYFTSSSKRSIYL